MIRIGTRSSALAMAQSRTIVAALGAHGVEAELVPMISQGDMSRASLASLGGTGIFATRLREGLLAGECDALVHSLKDLPTTPHPDLALVATPPREDPRDVLCGSTLAGLPPRARVGTGSPRRGARLLRERSDLQILDIRGNVATRLARALGADADLDAVVLAAAGLRRLGRTDVIDTYLDLPAAPGQGAIVVEIRAASAGLAEDFQCVHDPHTWAATTAERAMLARLEAGCAAPVAAAAEVRDHELHLQGVAYAPDGSQEIRGTMTAPRAEPAQDLGRALADDLLGRGAAAWIGA